MTGKKLKYLVLGFALAATSLYVLGVGTLTSFAPGNPIKSQEVNDNFTVLRTAIQTLEAPIGPARLAVTGTAADGKVLKYQGGGFTWADDDTGAGGGGDITGVNAGVGLAGGGTSGDVTLLLADGGVTNSKLTNNSVNAAKTADEPGIASAENDTEGTLGTISTSPHTLLEQATINAPSSGYVLLTGVVTLRFQHTSGTAQSAYLDMVTTNTLGNTVAQLAVIPSGAATGEYWQPVTVQRVYPVSAGSNNFFFRGTIADGNSGVSYDRVRLSAVFFPTAYGTVE